MERWARKVAVVTGASAGIGAAITKALAAKGLTVVGLARRDEKIKEYASTFNGKIHAVKCDLGKEEDILKAFRWIEDTLGGADILVNNAGVIRVSKLSDGSTEDWRDMLNTNVLALSICTREALKTMRNRGDNGHIININSVAGHYVPQYTNMFFSLYPATKFAVTALTEGLRIELGSMNSNIRVTSVSPGAIFTEMAQQTTKTLGIDLPGTRPPGYLDAEDVTDAVVYAIGTKPHVQVHEIIIRPLGRPDIRKLGDP